MNTSPCEAPSISGHRPASPCWILLLVLKIADHARQIATDEPDVSKWPPGLRLCRRWLRDAPNDPYLCARLKGVFQVRALDGEQLPRVFAKWSGSRSSWRRPAPREDTVWRVLWRQASRSTGYWRVLQLHGQGAVYLMMSKLSTLDADVCFTLEGRADDELPEVVFGAASFTALDLEKKFKQLRQRALDSLPSGEFAGLFDDDIS